MANLKPFQVIVTFEDPNGDESKKEYGFNTAMERRIYLWGVLDAAGLKIADVDEHDYRPPCMACNDRPVERTFVRAKGEREKTTRTVVKLCEKCSKNIIMLSMPYLADGGGEIVSEKEAFGLSSFEEHRKNTGLPEE